MKVGLGVSHELIDKMKEDMDFERSTDVQKMVGVVLEEIKVKSGLVFEKK